MKAQNFRRILFLTGILAAFVLYLCVSVSKLLPFFLVTGLAVFLAACFMTRAQSFAGIIRLTQKRE